MFKCQWEALAAAIKLATEKHHGQFDKAGKPYILHCLHVMNSVNNADPELMQIAVMHDLVEDTDVSAELLWEMGFSDRVVNGVLDMTKTKDLNYDCYLDIISRNLDAIKVKMADLRHNSDITRIKGLREKDLKRTAKYHAAYLKLKEARANFKTVSVEE